MTYKAIDLDEYNSPAALDWAASYYEAQSAVTEYVSQWHRTGTPKTDSLYAYQESAWQLETELWHDLMDLVEGEFT